MTTIRASHYDETEQALTNDPIVQDLAAGVSREPRTELAHDGGTPRHEFMGAANATYRERGGQGGGHIGAVASAILALLDEEPVPHWFQARDNISSVVGIARFRRWEVRAGKTRLTIHGTEYRVTAIEERAPDAAPDAHRIVTVSPV